MIYMDEFFKRCEPYQKIIDEVTIDECICVAMGIPIHCNREEMIVKAIVQRLWNAEQKAKPFMEYDLSDFSNTNKEQKSLAEIRRDAYTEGFMKGKAEGSAEALDELVKMACKYYTIQEHSGYYVDTNNLIKQKIADWADAIKERYR